MGRERQTMIFIAAQRTAMESNRASIATNRTRSLIRAVKDSLVFLLVNIRPDFRRLRSRELYSSRQITIL